VSRPAYEVADVVRLFGARLRTSGYVNRAQKKTLTAVEHCRTAALGGHVQACDGCGTVVFSYNSCRDRHCPKCQSVEREAWILSREADLLPVTYYHVVFTIPLEMNGLCMRNPRFMYDLLFDCAWATLQIFAADPKWLGAKTGSTMVLHTWGQNLTLHPHVHCVVPGGGLDSAGQWQGVRAGGDRFLFPVKAMSKVFRAMFMKRLCMRLDTGELSLPHTEEWHHTPARYRAWRNGLHRTPWVVYAKRPFGGPKQVIEYLGRYTHKSAISNHRLLEVSEQGVRFTYKDYRAEGKKKEMTLEGEEFLRRWTLHVLPRGFRRMRHFGILSNALKAKALAACRGSLEPSAAPPPKAKKDRAALRAEALVKLWQGRDPTLCRCCEAGHLVKIGVIHPQARDPPGGVPSWKPFATE
jgi:Putative transposase/Transposase zinc-binding domain